MYRTRIIPNYSYYCYILDVYGTEATPSAKFPLPHQDDFDAYEVDLTPSYFADFLLILLLILILIPRVLVVLLLLIIIIMIMFTIVMIIIITIIVRTSAAPGRLPPTRLGPATSCSSSGCRGRPVRTSGP